MRLPRLSGAVLAVLGVLWLYGLGWADDKVSLEQTNTHMNYIWTLIAAFLVFFMQAGFAMVETGFTRAKNACNIVLKNLIDFCLGSLAFWAVGFGLMFGVSNGWLGMSGFFLSDFNTSHDPWVYAFWLFQVVFAGTAATICSGAMAERVQFHGYIVYAIIVSAVIYPIFGGWAWGGLFEESKGWLEQLGFIDFAGSTVVHSVGAWTALAGIIVLGPRLGKYT